jgi:hypothetical protein
MGGGDIDLGEEGWRKSLNNEARIKRLELIMQIVCDRLGVDLKLSQIEEPEGLEEMFKALSGH